MIPFIKVNKGLKEIVRSDGLRIPFSAVTGFKINEDRCYQFTFSHAGREGTVYGHSIKDPEVASRAKEIFIITMANKLKHDVMRMLYDCRVFIFHYYVLIVNRRKSVWVYELNQFNKYIFNGKAAAMYYKAPERHKKCEMELITLQYGHGDKFPMKVERWESRSILETVAGFNNLISGLYDDCF